VPICAEPPLLFHYKKTDGGAPTGNIKARNLPDATAIAYRLSWKDPSKEELIAEIDWTSKEGIPSVVTKGRLFLDQVARHMILLVVLRDYLIVLIRKAYATLVD